MRSVVLLIRHSEDGALGLILNRRTDALLKEGWAKVSDVPCHRGDSIFLGGPCEGPLVALHSNEFLMEIEVLPGLYFCAGKEKLESLAAQQDGPPAKFFAGYAGWMPASWRRKSPAAHGPSCRPVPSTCFDSKTISGSAPAVKWPTPPGATR